MLVYPAIDPIAFHIGSWPVHWYGLTYLVGFVGGWALLALRTKFSPRGFSQDDVSDIVFYAALGAIIGGRIGYMLFYANNILFANPMSLFEVWKGGMSFHGGLLGVVIAMYLMARKFHKPLLELTDFVCPVVPIGLGAGRLGNFINGELWGRVTDVPWAMIFPTGGPMPRHPSQLYEFFLEGIVLFTFLWLYSSKRRPIGAVSGWFAILYGLFRITVEFFREPDANMGFVLGRMTEGQLLSIPLVLAGILMILYSRRQPKPEVSA